MVHIHSPPIFEQQAVVEAGDRAVSPPLIVDPPALQDCLRDEATTGQVDGSGLTDVGRFDADAPGSV